MTFIASVIAKEGVAIVADSFVTTVEYFIDQDDLINYLGKKTTKKDNIPLKDLFPLFEKKPSYTRNYMDKLFQFGNWSVITTTGQAYINKKLIKDLVKEIEIAMGVDTPAYEAKNIGEIISEFCSYIENEAIAHLADNNLTETSFIFSHYNRIINEAQVFSIKAKESVKGTYTAASSLVRSEELSHLKIVTDGQDTFVDKLIFGSLYKKIGKVKYEFLKYIFKSFKLSKAKKQQISDEVRNIDFLKDVLLEDIYSTKFRELSLQEAVDFCALLIKIVMDIQIYTEKIPTVGGLIRIATIRKDEGFHWVTGDKILTPKLIL